jgi:hypothetical protein
MTDTTNREMLELAARAAGYEVESDHQGVFHIREGTGLQSWTHWNPRDDNNDAFRLAARLKIQVSFGTFKDSVASAYKFGTPAVEVENTDIEAAAREAIFLMAVEIGKGMK